MFSGERGASSRGLFVFFVVSKINVFFNNQVVELIYFQ